MELVKGGSAGPMLVDQSAELPGTIVSWLESDGLPMEITDYDARYHWNVAPGEVMLFNNPVSFTGEVIETTTSHRVLKANNGMTIMVPNQALVWNGDTQMFSQAANI